MIDTKCPYCQIESEADDSQLNRAVRCPGCRKVFILHAHSTEISLDPIIPGVPRHKPDGERPPAASAREAPPQEGKPDTTKIDTAFRHTLKLRSVRKPVTTGPKPVSPLLDAEPALHHQPEPALHQPEPERREVEVTGVRMAFWDIFKTTGLVMLAILIYSLIGGALVCLALAVLGKFAGGK